MCGYRPRKMRDAFLRTPTGRVLRLVNAQGDESPAPLSSGNTGSVRAGPGLTTPIRQVAAENISAAGLPATDARFIFAVEVNRSLEGGKAAILRPERRRNLVASAVDMGLRPFDANLVIAIVQDQARQGFGISLDAEKSLRLVHAPQTRPAERIQLVLLAMLVISLGAAMFALLFAWFTGRL